MTKALATALAALALASAQTAVAATADGMRLAADDDNVVQVARYDQLLNRLQPRCREGRSGVARLTWSAKRVLDYRYTNLTLLLALSASIPGHARVSCTSRYASMVVLVELHR